MDLKTTIDKSNQEKDRVNHLNREIISLSKQIILKAHKGKTPLLAPIQEKVKEVLDLPIKNATIGLQEYVEAYAYVVYLKEKRLLTLDDVSPIPHGAYLKGIFDFTGELVRRATNAGIQGNPEETKAIHAFVEELYDTFSTLDLRGDLRKGMDQLRWNMKKLEEMAFALALKEQP